jgi:hypothetical protein
MVPWDFVPLHPPSIPHPILALLKWYVLEERLIHDVAPSHKTCCRLVLDFSGAMTGLSSARRYSHQHSCWVHAVDRVRSLMLPVISKLHYCPRLVANRYSYAACTRHRCIAASQSLIATSGARRQTAIRQSILTESSHLQSHHILPPRIVKRYRSSAPTTRRNRK